MKERLSRRDAIKALVLTGTALSLYGSVGLYPFTGLLELGSPRVKASELNIAFPETTPLDGTLVSVNKEEFSQALLRAAAAVDPIYGQAKVRELLEKRPLKIEIKEKSEAHYYDGEADGVGADYKPYLWILEGPQIIFYKDYLRSYYQAIKSIDLAAQVSNDTKGYHEIFHFLQDIRDPVGYILKASVSGIRERVNQLTFMPQFEPWEDPTEKDAWTKAGALSEQLFNGYVDQGVTSPWPFGRFFNFAEVL